MIQILATGKTLEIERASDRPAGELWLSADALADLTGWRLKTEGLCRDEVCVPLNDSVREKLVAGDQVHTSGLWEELGRPVLHDSAESTSGRHPPLSPHREGSIPERVQQGP